MSTSVTEIERVLALRLYESLLRAWNNRDADAFASLFADAASVVGFDGSEMNGPEEVAATLRGIFKDHPTASYVASVRGIRSIGADVWLLRSAVGMVPPGTSDINSKTNAIQSLIMVGSGDDLRIALLQNTPAAFHGRDDLAAALTEELKGVLQSRRLTADGGH